MIVQTELIQTERDLPYEHGPVGLDTARGLVPAPEKVRSGFVLSDSLFTYRFRRRYRTVERTAHLLDVPSVAVVETGRSLKALGWGVVLLLGGFALAAVGTLQLLSRGISSLMEEVADGAPFAGAGVNQIIGQFEQSSLLMGGCALAAGSLALVYFMISARLSVDVSLKGEQVSLPLSRAHVEAAELFSRFCSRRRNEMLTSVT